MTTINKIIFRIRRSCTTAGACVIMVSLFSGCAAVQQSPRDPENISATLSRLAPYYDGTKEAEYYALTDETLRATKRNEIISNMMRGYDLAFGEFETQLSAFSNSVSVGSDLIGLALGGLTATVGGAATKAALGAASVGILGANTAINKDLFFQKTLPALKAQMEANRLQKKLPIAKGLTQSDSKYPLSVAYGDLEDYKNAGRLDDAVAALTKTADAAKQVASDNITFVRTESDVKQLPDTQKVQAAYRALSDKQVLNLANLMQPNLTNRPTGIQALVKDIDKNSDRLNGNITAARDVMNAWISEEDMTPANTKQWMDAIAAAAK